MLESIRTRPDKDFTVIVVPDLNHTWVRNGAPCELEGPGGIDGILITSWLAERFADWPAWRLLNPVKEDAP